MNLYLDEHKMTQKAILTAGKWGYEPETLTFIKRMLHKGDTFIDCGAHVGFFTVLAAEIVKTGTVYSFEPEPENYKDLLGNIEANKFKNVRAFNNAVGDKDAAVEMYVNEDNDGGHSLWNPSSHPENIKTKKHGAKKISVDMVRLDSVIDDVPKIIKIDVEGCEMMVLQGAKRILENHSPHVIMEINWYALQQMGSSHGAIQDYMEGLGYTVYDLNSCVRIDLKTMTMPEYVFNVAFIRMIH